MKKKCALLLELLCICSMVLTLTACPQEPVTFLYDPEKADWLTQFAGAWELDNPEYANWRTFFNLEYEYINRGSMRDFAVKGETVTYERSQSYYGEYDYINETSKPNIYVYNSDTIYYYGDPLPEDSYSFEELYLFPDIEEGTPLLPSRYPFTLELSDDKNSLTATVYETEWDYWTNVTTPTIVTYTFHKITAVPTPIPYPLPPENPEDPGNGGGSGDPSAFAGTYSYTTGHESTNGSLTLNDDGTWIYHGNKQGYEGKNGTYSVSGSTITISATNVSGLDVSDSFTVTTNGNSVTWTQASNSNSLFLQTYFSCIYSITFTKS